jgi:hypothetical protein
VKKAFIALAIVVATLAIGLSGSAQEWNDANPDSSTTRAAQIVHFSGSITGLLESTARECTKGFSNQCPSGHTCSCLTGTGVKVSSRALGGGTANIFATVDNTASFATLGDCAPVYAEIDITAKKDSPIFNVVGAMCFEPDGNAVFNGAMGLATTSKRFTTTGSAGYTAVLKCTSGLCGGSFHMALNFKGTAK